MNHENKFESNKRELKYTNLFLWANRINFFYRFQDMNISFPVTYTYATSRSNEYSKRNLTSVLELIRALEDAPYKNEWPISIGDISFSAIFEYQNELQRKIILLLYSTSQVWEITEDILMKNGLSSYVEIVTDLAIDGVAPFYGELRQSIWEINALIPTNYGVIIRR